jgi:hypothetical protein
MKSFKNILALAISGLAIFSCSNGNKAIKEYCECMSSVINDSLVSTGLLKERHTICYDSIVAKYKLNEDKEFKNTFDSLKDVKDFRDKIYTKIIKNVDDILQRYNWGYQDLSSLNWQTYEARKYYFDGKMFKQEVYGMQWGSTQWHLKKTWTGTYKIEKANNGKIYVTVSTEPGENDIYLLQKSKKDGYYLDGRRTVWQEQK